MKPRTELSINVFLKALETDTIVKGTCSACAVGNMIAAANSVRVRKHPTQQFGKDMLNYVTDNFIPNWVRVFVTTHKGVQRYYPEKLTGAIEKMLLKTNFTIDELRIIEHTFETTAKHHYLSYPTLHPNIVRQDILNGLIAVVEEMLLFDKSTKDVKDVFTSKALLIPVNS